MDSEQDRLEAPPTAPSRTRRDIGGDGEGNGDDDNAEEPQEADGELEVEMRIITTCLRQVVMMESLFPWSLTWHTVRGPRG